MKRVAWGLSLLVAAQCEGGTQAALFIPVAVQTVVSAAASPSQPVAVVSGDWNADNRMDLAIVDSLGNRVSVVLGDGSSSFLQAADFPTGTTPMALAASIKSSSFIANVGP